MPSKLTKLVLQNFKSVPFASLDVSGLTFLVGRNGSGKSNISDAFSFLSEAMDQPLQAVLNRRGGPSNVAHKNPTHPDLPRVPPREISMGLAVEFIDLPPFMPHHLKIRKARYAVEIKTSLRGFKISREQCSIWEEDGTHKWFDRDIYDFRTNLDIFNGFTVSMITPQSLWLQTFGGFVDFAPVAQAIRSMAVYAIEPTTLREFQNHDVSSRLLPDGSNAASILQQLASHNPESFRRLIEILSTILPELKDIKSVHIGRKQVLRFYQSWTSGAFGRERLHFDAFNMSDGTLRSFAILLAIFQIHRPSLVLIEEPESSIHPGATGAILEVLRSISDNTQVVITTHSPEVLDFADAGDVIRVVSWHRGRTRVDDVRGVAREALQNHLSTPGELFRMQVLDAPTLFEDEFPHEQLFEDLG